MAKPVLLSFDGHDVAFAARRVERGQLYGTRKRVAVDRDGRVCTKAALTRDGATLLLSGMTAQGHFAPDGRWIARSEMVGLDAAGQPVPTQPSTLGVPQTVVGPVPPAELLTFSLESVYLLTPEDPKAPLVTALHDGRIYRCAFNYTVGLQTEVAYLVGTADACFALVGQPVEMPWTEEGAAFVPDVSAEEADADLDFEQL